MARFAHAQVSRVGEVKSAIPILLFAVALACGAPSFARAQSSVSSARAHSGAHSVASRHTTVGKASWYGPRVQGRKTATGERFDSRKMTAASTRLPLGSHAVVTNLNNGRSVRVRVNDCGPFVQGRNVDVSKRAARQLGMIRDGTAPVAVRVVYVPRGAMRCGRAGSQVAED